MNRKLIVLAAVILVAASVVVYRFMKQPPPPKIDYTQRAGTEVKTPVIEMPDIGPYEAEEEYLPVRPWTPVEYSVPKPLIAGETYVFTGRVLVNKPAGGPFRLRTYMARGIIPPTVEDVVEHFQWVNSKPVTTIVESDGPYAIREYKYLVHVPEEPGDYTFFITNMAMLAPREYVFLRATFQAQGRESVPQD